MIQMRVISRQRKSKFSLAGFPFDVHHVKSYFYRHENTPTTFLKITKNQRAFLGVEVKFEVNKVNKDK